MFVTVTLITLICLGVNYILSNFWHRPFIKKINTLPGPTGYPLVGSTFYFLGIITNEIMQIVNTLVNDFSSPFRIWFGNTAYIGVYDGEHIKAVLQSRCFKKSSLYKVFKPALGTGLITSHVQLGEVEFVYLWHLMREIHVAQHGVVEFVDSWHLYLYGAQIEKWWREFFL
ncbi:cytochrome P450 4C1-like isoform X1 [Linepithema humile]|uniref:cytochrome P450 4C1-like isoform X1 n=1 Tax=Linepithema humile TaxID=83485 RepID=UPI00351E3692